MASQLVGSLDDRERAGVHSKKRSEAKTWWHHSYRDINQALLRCYGLSGEVSKCVVVAQIAIKIIQPPLPT